MASGAHHHEGLCQQQLHWLFCLGALLGLKPLLQQEAGGRAAAAVLLRHPSALAGTVVRHPSALAGTVVRHPSALAGTCKISFSCALPPAAASHVS